MAADCATPVPIHLRSNVITIGRRTKISPGANNLHSGHWRLHKPDLDPDPIRYHAARQHRSQRVSMYRNWRTSQALLLDLRSTAYTTNTRRGPPFSELSNTTYTLVTVNNLHGKPDGPPTRTSFLTNNLRLTAPWPDEWHPSCCRRPPCWPRFGNVRPFLEPAKINVRTCLQPRAQQMHSCRSRTT